MSSPGVYWRIPDTPAWGWPELTFPIQTHVAPDQKQWFAAFQWQFKGKGGNVAYTGVQPAPRGMQDLRFSVFGEGTETVDHGRCHGGADGGSGVTCDGTSIPLVMSRLYLLRVRRQDAGSRVWLGTVTDAETEQTWETGAWRISVDGGLPGWGQAWLEHYISCACNKMPMFSVHFGAPYHAPSGTTGYLYSPENGGGCAGSNNWAAEIKEDGARCWMRSGWPGVSCRDRRTLPDPGDHAVTVDVDVTVNHREVCR